MEKYNGQLKDVKYNIETHVSHHKRENQPYKTYFSNDILTFDTEVTSAFIKDGNVIPYKKGKTAEYWNDLIPISLLYIWQFSFNEKVYYGRTIEEFLNVLHDIPKSLNCVIWVHNLAYEFQFLLNILEVDEVFARSKRKPMKVKFKKFPNIEFRCSYYLTRLSLDSWGKQIGIKKLVGFLDYDKLRTPLTKLTEKEMAYGERDCIVVYNGIKVYLTKYKSIRNIPLTQTGTVRREIKDLLTSDPVYVSNIKKLVPRSLEEYNLLKAVFAGGYTHANRYWSGQVIEDEIEHYDFASSYPYCMIAEKYPMTPWVYMGKSMPDMESFEDNAYILDLTFHNVRSTVFNTYIQASKCTGKNFVYDNGRVMRADELRITITEQDYITINNNYEWDKIEVNRVYQSTKEYLPKDFIEYILELYGNKTTLKGVEGYEDIYLQSKQYINSMFGMMVTAIVQADILFNDGVWSTNVLTKEFVEHKLKMLAQRNPREKRYFLSYSWGCWVTAYARRNLWSCIETCDHDMLYTDTDSIFVLKGHDFTWYNNRVDEKVKKVCVYYNINFERTRPKNPDGEKFPIGKFDSEKECSAFITLGAKRYLERRANDGKLYMTISGINKEAVELLNDNMYNFKDGFVFDKDSEHVKKKLLTYIDDQPEVTYPDGYISKYKYGINMRNTGYKLSITDEYKDLINYMDYDAGELDEVFDVQIRAHIV